MIIALPDLVEMLEGVREEVGCDGGAVRLFQVQLLQVAALVQTAHRRHQHPVSVATIDQSVNISISNYN